MQKHWKTATSNTFRVSLPNPFSENICNAGKNEDIIPL
jgi:hypothetical protein